MFTARAATRSTVIAEVADSTSMSAFAQRVSGIESVGLNASGVRERDVHVVEEPRVPAAARRAAGSPSAGTGSRAAAGPARGAGPARPGRRPQNQRPNAITFVLQTVIPLRSSSAPLCSWPFEHRPHQRQQGDAVCGAHEPEQGERGRAPVAELLELVARPRPRERDQEHELGHGRRQPPPPRQHPELPALRLADGREGDLQEHDQRDGRRRLPARLDLGLVHIPVLHARTASHSPAAIWARIDPTR